MSDNSGAKPPEIRLTSKTLSRSASAKIAFSLAAVMTVLGPAQMAAAAEAESRFRNPDTKYSRTTQDLTREFNDKAKDVRIVVMDRDWFQVNLALQQIPAFDAQARAQLAADYMKERTGVDVSPYKLKAYGIAQELEHGEGHAWPAGVGPTGGQNPGVCVVFGQLADLDAPTQTSYLTGIGSDLHPELQGRRLKNVMPVETFRKHVDYHEIGHCLYHSQMNTGPQTMGEAMVERNRSEMYAEIMAALLMAHYDGIDDFAERAANLRLVSGALNGPAFAHYGSPEDFQSYSPAMYTIHAGVRDAGREIDRLGVRKIQRMSMDELRALGYEILERNDLDVKKMEAIMMMFAGQFDLTKVRELSEKDSRYRGAYLYVVNLRAEMAAALPEVVDLKGFDRNKSVLDQIKIDFEAFEAKQQMNQFKLSVASGPADADIVRVTKDRLIAQAGGADATVDGLIDAFREYKDFLRRQLERGNASQREAAMRILPLTGKGLYEAVREIQGLQPDAGNDNDTQKVVPRPEFYGPQYRPAV